MTFDTILGTGGIVGTPKPPTDSSSNQIIITVSALSSFEAGSTVSVKVTLNINPLFTYGVNNTLEFGSGVKVTTPQLPTVTGGGTFKSYFISSSLDAENLISHGLTFDPQSGGITGVPIVPAGKTDGQFTITVSAKNEADGDLVTSKVTINVIPKNGFVITADKGLEYYTNDVFVKKAQTAFKGNLQSVSYTGNAVYITSSGSSDELDKCDSSGNNCKKIEASPWCSVMGSVSYSKEGNGYLLCVEADQYWRWSDTLVPFINDQPQPSKKLWTGESYDTPGPGAISYAGNAVYVIVSSDANHVLKKCDTAGSNCKDMDTGNPISHGRAATSFQADGSGYVMTTTILGEGSLDYFSKEGTAIRGIYAFDKSAPPTAISYTGEALYMTLGSTDLKSGKLLRCDVPVTNNSCKVIDTFKSTPVGVSFN